MVFYALFCRCSEGSLRGRLVEDGALASEDPAEEAAVRHAEEEADR